MNTSLEYYKERWGYLFSNVYAGFDLPAGWAPLFEKLCEELEENQLHNRITIVQVTEEWGRLRVYTEYSDLEYWETAPDYKLGDCERILSRAERFSRLVCESCATTANVTTSGRWVLTLCESCRERKERAV